MSISQNSSNCDSLDLSFQQLQQLIAMNDDSSSMGSLIDSAHVSSTVNTSDCLSLDASVSTTCSTSADQNDSNQSNCANQVKLRKGFTLTTTKHVPHREKPPQLVARRNARERKRVQAVNSAFLNLRRTIPIENRNKRVSKVKTLQKAIEYIAALQHLLHDIDEPASNTLNKQPVVSNNNNNHESTLVNVTTTTSNNNQDLQHCGSISSSLSSSSVSTLSDEELLQLNQSAFVNTNSHSNSLPISYASSSSTSSLTSTGSASPSSSSSSHLLLQTSGHMNIISQSQQSLQSQCASSLSSTFPVFDSPSPISCSIDSYSSQTAPQMIHPSLDYNNYPIQPNCANHSMHLTSMHSIPTYSSNMNVQTSPLLNSSLEMINPLPTSNSSSSSFTYNSTLPHSVTSTPLANYSSAYHSI